MRHGPILVAVASLLAGCGEKVVCNSEGKIIVPADANIDQRQRWVGENFDLEMRRFNATMGDRERARFYTQDMLARADSCPRPGA